MELEINEKKNNPLFKRTEVHFTITHENEKTTNRKIIQNQLAEALNAKKDAIIVERIDSSFGLQQTTGYAKVYSSKKHAEAIERKHQLKRNKIDSSGGSKKKEEEKTEEKPEATEETKKEEGSEEKKKEE
ncbi:MAG: 30S ribosomal protein S24e [Thermoplasmatota archaeon]